MIFSRNMAPLIEHDTNLSDLRYSKYVREEGTIAYGSAMDEHAMIAKKNNLRRRGDNPNSTYVSDAGHINPEGGKLVFQTKSITCKIYGNLGEANKITRELAKSILGDEVVW